MTSEQLVPWVVGIGGALQIFGVLLVLRDLSQSRRQLDPSYVGLMRRWGSSLAFWRPRSLAIDGSSHSVSSDVGALIVARPDVGAMSANEQLQHALLRIEALDRCVAELHQKVDNNRVLVRQELSATTEELRARVDGVKALLRNLAESSYRVQAFSVSLLLWGIAFSTWARPFSSMFVLVGRALSSASLTLGWPTL